MFLQCEIPFPTETGTGREVRSRSDDLGVRPREASESGSGHTVLRVDLRTSLEVVWTSLALLPAPPVRVARKTSSFRRT